MAVGQRFATDGCAITAIARFALVRALHGPLRRQMSGAPKRTWKPITRKSQKRISSERCVITPFSNCLALLRQRHRMKKLSELFEVRSGHCLELHELRRVSRSNGIAFVSRKGRDNGIVAYVARLPGIVPG